MVENIKGINAITVKIDIKINFLLNLILNFDKITKVKIAKIYGIEVGRVK